MASVTVLVLLAVAPLADVWPYRAKRQPDGATEYSYDLTLVKAAQPSPDALAAHGEDAVRAFLRELPKDVKVRATPGPIVVGAGRGPEPRPLAASFAQVDDGAIASDNPLAKDPGARLRPPLHPEQPKVIPGADLVLWEARSLEDGALAALELDTERLRRDLWGRVLDQAVARARTAQGDAKEGAIALVARVAAASACLDRTKAPAAVKASPELTTAFEAEIQRLSADPDATVAAPPWSWSPELTCAWVGARAFSRPFEQSRAGTAAVLTFLDLLAKDAKVRALWERVRARRDRFLGEPVAEPVLGWRERAGDDATRGLDSLGEFLESLPIVDRVPPPLVAAPVSPYGRFLAELSGAERGLAADELASAVQDGRVTPAVGPAVPWPTAREAWLSPLVADPQKGLQVEAAWHERLVSVFAALQGLHHEARAVSREPELESGERSALTVRLMIPPVLEVEPVGLAYERAAASLERLVALLEPEGLGGVRVVTTDGRRGAQLASEVRRFAPVLRGLARLAVDPTTDAREAAAARAFVARWRSEAALTHDVRTAAAAPWAIAGERAHAAIAGVGRRELTVAFSSPVRAEVVGPRGPFELSTQAEQRYIVPLLVTVQATAPAATPPLDRAALKGAIDGVKRDPTRVEGAFAEALHR